MNRRALRRSGCPFFMWVFISFFFVPGVHGDDSDTFYAHLCGTRDPRRGDLSQAHDRIGKLRALPRLTRSGGSQER